MTADPLSQSVTDLIDLKRRIAELETERDALQRVFIEAAQAQLQLDGHKTFIGCEYSFKGTDGSLCRVNFPNDKLISDFRFNDRDEAFRTKGTGAKAEIIKLTGLRRLAGDKFPKLFVEKFTPAKSFRDLAKAMLSETSADQLIDLLTEPSSPRVSTEVAEVVP